MTDPGGRARVVVGVTAPVLLRVLFAPEGFARVVDCRENCVGGHCGHAATSAGSVPGALPVRPGAAPRAQVGRSSEARTSLNQAEPVALESIADVVERPGFLRASCPERKACAGRLARFRLQTGALGLTCEGTNVAPGGTWQAE